MNTLMISIDGACRRNGKPDCVSAGGVFIQMINDQKGVILNDTLNLYEKPSTNQRGELMALLRALDYIWSAKLPTLVITDSEYVFNAMTKEWHNTWSNNNWIASSGEPVKNAEIWLQIHQAVEKCRNADIDITFYHIKGHCIPFGKVTATRLLEADKTGSTLYKEVESKFKSVKDRYALKLKEANELSMKNNGYALPDNLLERFVIMNVMADAVATQWVEHADRTL